MLWNKNFILLTVANVLLHISVYMTFPLFYRWLLQEWGCTPIEALALSLLWGATLFLPGPFNNYLVDAFSRKKVGAYSVGLMVLSGLVMPYVTQLWMLAVLRGMQGALFGIALMATGSTLVIDVTPRTKRDAANRVFTWAGILGLLAGGVFGRYGLENLTWDYLLYVSAGCGGVAALLVSLVTVCFRAPLNLPLCSFDRFILFRTFLPGVNMLAVPLVLGMVLALIPDTFFYLCVMGGFVSYLLIRQIFTSPMNGRLQILAGQFLMGGGVLWLWNHLQDSDLCVGGLLIGLGAGFSLGQFLRMMILLPFHCERGSGYHTFQLLWQSAMMAGMMIPVYMRQGTGKDPYAVGLVISLYGLLFYQVYIHGYFSRHMSEK